LKRAFSKRKTLLQYFWYIKGHKKEHKQLKNVIRFLYRAYSSLQNRLVRWGVTLYKPST